MPFQHKAQLANAVTSFATCLGGIMPLLYCWLGRSQPRRWVVVYLCVLVTGIPTVILHAYEGNRLASFFDVGTNILLAYALEIAVSGDFMRAPARKKLLTVLTFVNVGVWLYLAWEVFAPVKKPIITFGPHGEFYFGETALILNAFVVLGLFIKSYRLFPKQSRPMFFLIVLMFLVGLVLATGSNSLVTQRVVAWHATWHLVGAFGFITMWFFNDIRFNQVQSPTAQ
jgi:hypothetical protein